MKVTPLPEVVPTGSRRRVAIGTFDGVHLGHREVIRGSDTVLTFDPHPSTVVRPDATPKLVNAFGVKRDLIAGLGVDELVVIPFDREFASKDAEHFVDEVLVGRLEAEQVSVGQNFHFGKGARGTPDFLRSHDEFETRVVPLVEVGDGPVSSTRVRELVEGGEVADAATLLGGPFLFEGEVVSGDRRGRELGIPTANLVPDPALVCPAQGVYAAWAHGHPAAVNVGVRPTFESGRGLLVEAHLLDFEGDLYGETLRIAFLERLRGEQRFESVDALVGQMRSDVQHTREICARIRFDQASS
jgi:riboflavin kinase / FMN adenylyltransferase